MSRYDLFYGAHILIRGPMKRDPIDVAIDVSNDKRLTILIV